MSKLMIQTDGDVISVTMPADKSSGAGVLVGGIFGIALADYLSGAAGDVKTNGVHFIAKTAAITFSQGAAVYWDNTAGSVTSVAAGNRKIGNAAAAAAADDTYAQVRLDGVAGPISQDDNASA